MVRLFIEEMGLGRVPTAAARRAGYKSPHKASQDLLADPEIVAAIAVIQAETAKKSDMAREDVMSNLMRAFRIAEQMDDPQSMIRAMSEVNRMCGHYAPEKKILEVTGEIKHMQQQLEELPKEELLRLLGESEETPLLEAIPTETGLFVVEDEDPEV
jgi:phage terminase small subunit